MSFFVKSIQDTLVTGFLLTKTYFLDDNFNLYGLRDTIGSNFKKCLDVILDKVDSTGEIDRSVEDLYGLIHARFIVTKRGQDKMKRKYRNTDFGLCPLLSCQQQPVLPVGLKDKIDENSVMVYCPRCNQVMLPSIRSGDDVDLDGAYFGTTFPHLFLMQFPELRPPPPLKVAPYIPKVFGFKVKFPANPDPLLNGDTFIEVMGEEKVEVEKTPIV